MTRDDSAGLGADPGSFGPAFALRLPSTPPAGRWYARAGLLIDGQGSDPVPDAIVAVEGEQIAAVGSAEAFGTALDDATRVADFTGQVLMPGLVDCHAHPTRPSDSRSPDEQLSVPDEMLAIT